MTSKEEVELATKYGWYARLDISRGDTWYLFKRGDFTIWSVNVRGNNWSKAKLEDGYYLDHQYFVTLEEALAAE